MKISWNWLSEMVDLSTLRGPEGLAELLTSRGLEVEEIQAQGQGFEKVVSAQILEKKPHPQADRLSLCKVSTGSGDPLDIVCGAQNMKAGDKVALAQVGANLPNGMKIAAGKIRGEVSNGMLCSEEELGLKTSSEGILILPPETALGQPVAKLLGRDDTVFTLKLTANRGDCLSHYGLAREVASALGKKPCRPQGPELQLKGSAIRVALDAGAAAPQFWGAMLEGVKVGSSPEWVVRRLEALGQRSINNVVDATNLLMLELGQPVHAYDADRLEGGRIGVRVARAGEELSLLDGTSVRLEGFELVICDGAQGTRAIGLAGVMGGGTTEVRESTTRVFLECAEFNPSQVRRASSKHQKKTEAAHRFERGIDPAGCGAAIARLAKLVTDLAGGQVVSATNAVAEASADKATSRGVAFNPDFVRRFLGIEVEDTEIRKILEGLDCRVDGEGASWKVTAPSYRHDLKSREDLAEEVARTVGYDRIPSTLPSLSSAPTPVAEDPAGAELLLMGRAKRALADSGLSEALNLSFTSRGWLEQLGFRATVQVINPLSEELALMVPSLLPGLLRNSLDNWRHHFGSDPLPIRLFEMRPTFSSSVTEGASGPSSPSELTAKSEMETSAIETWKLAFALSGPRLASGLRGDLGEVDFFDVKGVFERLLEELGASRGVRLQPLSASRGGGSADWASVRELLHPGQSVEILAGSQVAGYFGLLHPGQARNLKTRAPLWIGEMDWAALRKLSLKAGEQRTYKPLAELPPMERDFALLVGNEITADKITQVALKAGKPLAKVARIFDVYRGSQVTEGMTSVAVRVIFSDEGRSLQEAETEAASTRILEAWKKELGAQLRGTESVSSPSQ